MTKGRRLDQANAYFDLLLVLNCMLRAASSSCVCTVQISSPNHDGHDCLRRGCVIPSLVADLGLHPRCSQSASGDRFRFPLSITNLCKNKQKSLTGSLRFKYAQCTADRAVDLPIDLGRVSSGSTYQITKLRADRLQRVSTDCNEYISRSGRCIDDRFCILSCDGCCV